MELTETKCVLAGPRGTHALPYTKIHIRCQWKFREPKEITKIT